MKVLLGQINTTPRAFSNNYDKILHGLGIAKKENVDLAVFPELSIPGYSSRDLVYGENFIHNNKIWLDNLNRMVRETIKWDGTAIIGYVVKNNKGIGKPFKNRAVAISKGLVLDTYDKHLLPFYDVFDEGRYFEPGTDLTVLEICGRRWGIIVCEDAWNDKGSDDYNYRVNPLQKYRDIGIKNFISINSSPYADGKPLARMKMITQCADEDGTFIYVNQVGGQDELVFDGHSFIIKNQELVPGSLCDIEECYKIVDLDAPVESNGNWHTIAAKNDLNNRMEQLDKIITLGIKDYIAKCGFQQIVVASSGGIDSAVVIAKACDAVGANNVHAIRMPSVYSSGGSVDDAAELHTKLGCNDYIVPIDFLEEVGTLKTAFRMEDYHPVADENLQARQRAKFAMWFSNANKKPTLLLTTGNKTELALGYATIGGDMMGGFAPISDLYKTQVYELARFINEKHPVIPQNIIDKPPSAELAPGQTDESSLIPYRLLDPLVMAYIEEYIDDFGTFIKWIEKNQYCLNFWWNDITLVESYNNFPEIEKQYYRMISMIDLAEFKRRFVPPGIKVSKVAFGSGRRLPIAKQRRLG